MGSAGAAWPMGKRCPPPLWHPGLRARSPSGAVRVRASERSEAALGTTKEVLAIIDFLVFNHDFLGFPSIVLGFINIS